MAGHRREAEREQVGEEVDLDDALAEGRDPEREGAQGVVEVLPEALRRHLGREIAVRRAEDAHVHRHLALPAEPHDGARVDRRHQLRLRARRQLADAVEEQRPAARRLEVPDLARRAAAPLVAEEGPLQQHVREVRAVDAHVGIVRPRAPAVDLRGDDLLPDAGFPLHEDGRVRAGELLGEREDVAHLRVCHRHADRPVVAVANGGGRVLFVRRSGLRRVDRGRDEHFADAEADRVAAHHRPLRALQRRAVHLRPVPARAVLAKKDRPLAEDAGVLARDARVVDRHGGRPCAPERDFVAVVHLDHARAVPLVDEEERAPALPPDAVGELHPERRPRVAREMVRPGELGGDRHRRGRHGDGVFAGGLASHGAEPGYARSGALALLALEAHENARGWVAALRHGHYGFAGSFCAWRPWRACIVARMRANPRGRAADYETCRRNA